MAGCVIYKELMAQWMVQELPVTEFVAQNPAAVWAVGPFFAAVTGVAFKEVCGPFDASGIFVLLIACFKQQCFRPLSLRNSPFSGGSSIRCCAIREGGWWCRD
jgi:hypothetical protein